MLTVDTVGFLAAFDGPVSRYGPILVLIGFTMMVATSIIVITHILPKGKRKGRDKDDTYESGMPVIGDARRRFSVRFYLVAMLFLLFDVELIFMYPWALVFFDARGAEPMNAGMVAFLLVEMAIFFALLVVGFAYDWGKGVFRYD